MNCIVEHCTSKQSPSNQYGMCFRHGDWMTFLLWALPRVKVEASKEGQLWTPGVEQARTARPIMTPSPGASKKRPQ